MGSKFKKAKVLTKFYDSEAKVIRGRGDIIEITPARFCELVNNGKFVEAYAEPERAEEPPSK